MPNGTQDKVDADWQYNAGIPQTRDQTKAPVADRGF